MENGMRDLSKVVMPVAITADERMLPLIHRSIFNYFMSITDVIEREDKKLLDTMTELEQKKHIQIELYIALCQIIHKTMKKEEHIPGPDCPVCNQLKKLQICHEVLMQYWTNKGLMKEYSDAVRFRDGAVNPERSLN